MSNSLFDFGILPQHRGNFKNASNENLADYSLSGGGIGIHWDNLDEDLYVPNLLLGIYSVEKKSVSA